jgi:hypothetical protein
MKQANPFNGNHILGSPVFAPEELHVYRQVCFVNDPRSVGAISRFSDHIALLRSARRTVSGSYKHVAPPEQRQVSHVCDCRTQALAVIRASRDLLLSIPFDADARLQEVATDELFLADLNVTLEDFGQR